MEDSSEHPELTSPHELFNAQPLLVQTQGREVAIRWLSCASLGRLEDLRADIPDEEAFLRRALYEHLADPQISFPEFEQWRAEDVYVLARAWSSWHAGLDRPLPETHVARTFTAAFDDYSAASAKQLESVLAPIRAHFDLQQRALQDVARSGLGSIRAIEQALGSRLQSTILAAMHGLRDDVARAARQASEIAEMTTRAHTLVDTTRFTVDWEAVERRLANLAPYAEELGRRGWTFPIQWSGTRFVEVVKQVPEEELDDGWVGYYTGQDGAAFEELASYLV